MVDNKNGLSATESETRHLASPGEALRRRRRAGSALDVPGPPPGGRWIWQCWSDATAQWMETHYGVVHFAA